MHIIVETYFLSRYYSVHSATLGKGNSDDTLIKIKNGDMDYKGEVAMVFGKQVSRAKRIKRPRTETN
jgi:carboxymethylenebutenolidase